MITLNDKLVQLVTKWWIDDKISRLRAGLYSDGRLFVATPYMGVFLRTRPFDAEKLVKSCDDILTPEQIQRVAPFVKGPLDSECILWPTGNLCVWERGVVCEYQDVKGENVYLDERQRKQLMPLKSMAVDLYIRGARDTHTPVCFVDAVSSAVYAVCMPVKQKKRDAQND